MQYENGLQEYKYEHKNDSWEAIAVFPVTNNDGLYLVVTIDMWRSV